MAVCGRSPEEALKSGNQWVSHRWQGCGVPAEGK